MEQNRIYNPLTCFFILFLWSCFHCVAHDHSDSAYITGNKWSICVSGFNDLLYSSDIKDDSDVQISTDRKVSYSIGIEYWHPLNAYFSLSGKFRFNPFWTTTYHQRVGPELHGKDSFFHGYNGEIINVFNISSTFLVHCKYRSIDLGIGFVTGYYTGGKATRYLTEYDVGLTDGRRNLIWNSHFIVGPTIEFGYTEDEFRIALYHQRSLTRPIHLSNNTHYTPGLEFGIHVAYCISTRVNSNSVDN